jgi:putative transposase
MFEISRQEWACASPSQNPIGITSIVLGERYLHRILKSCFACYHGSRTQLSLGKDAPDPRAVHPPSLGKIVEIPQVGGLHHRYARLAV